MLKFIINTMYRYKIASAFIIHKFVLCTFSIGDGGSPEYDRLLAYLSRDILYKFVILTLASQSSLEASFCINVLGFNLGSAY